MKLSEKRRIACLGIVCLAIVNFSTACTPTNPFGSGNATTTCNVKDYGATGNGNTKDTAAIQKAINACTGGTVDFPAGKYLTAPLFLLKNNITLNIGSGATILGSTAPSDYILKKGEKVATTTLPLINTDDVNNITITGGGVINGQGSSWWSAKTTSSKRPRLIEFANGSNFTVSNVTLENAASFHLFLKSTKNVLVNGVTINAPSTSFDTVGIASESATNLTIENSHISDSDDDIGIKAQHAGQPSSAVTIKDCTIGSGAGIAIGTDITGGITNMNVSNITFNGTDYGLRIKSSRTLGGEISKVTYTGITMTNVKEPLSFLAYYPDMPASDSPHPITSTTPYYHDITVNNLTATGATSAGFIVGVPEKPLTNIDLNAVKITAQNALQVRNATVSGNVIG